MKPGERQQWINSLRDGLRNMANTLWALEREGQIDYELLASFSKRLKLYEDACKKHEHLLKNGE